MTTAIRSPRWFPTLAGLLAGLVLSLPATLSASAPWVGLYLTSVVPDSTVAGVITLAASADGPGVSSVQFQVSGQNVGPEITAGSCATPWDTRSVADGTHTIGIVARDSSGNTLVSAPVLVTVQNTAPTSADMTLPTVSVTTPSGGATVSGSINVTAAASDNVGVVGVWFTIDGSTVGGEDAAAPYQLSWATSSISNGTHTIRAVARDVANNIATSSPINVTVNNPTSSGDTTAPSVNITTPVNNANVSGTVTVSASATDAVGVLGVRFTVNGSTIGVEDTTAPYAVLWDAANLASAEYTLRAIARDAAGNVATSPAIYVRPGTTSTSDAQPPSVSVTSPESGTTVAGIVTVSAAATDDVAVAGVQFTLDGKAIGSEDTTAPYQVSWSPTGVSSGSHTFRAIARDKAGNTATSAGRTVTIASLSSSDTTPPTVSLLPPFSRNGTLNGTVTLTATATDNVGVVGVTFSVDGAPIGPEDGASPFSMSWKTSSVKNGTHTLRATARDAAGNTTSSDLVVTVRNLVKSDASAGGCTTADPFLTMGGGYCVAGGWTPWIPEMEFGDTALSAPETSLASSESTGSCSLPDPFAILGGGTCSLGGWLPPGMPVTSPSPTTPTVAPNQVATVSVSTQTSGACTTPDPFVTLGGGICIGGGWVPKGLVVGGR